MRAAPGLAAGVRGTSHVPLWASKHEPCPATVPCWLTLFSRYWLRPHLFLSKPLTHAETGAQYDTAALQQRAAGIAARLRGNMRASTVAIIETVRAAS